MSMRKTNFRWIIIAILFALNVISYIDRSAIAYAVPNIMHDLNLDAYHMGLVLGSFGIGYLIATFLGGIAVDKWGARKILLLFTLVWAFSIGCTAVVTGFLLAYVTRFGLGVGEGPNFPAVARAVSEWLPVQARARAFANSLVAVPLSLAIGAPLATLLIITIGWRWMFMILGLLVLLWWPLCYFLFTNKPQQSHFVNQQELDFIQQKQTMAKTPKAIWRYFFTNKTLLSNNWGFFVFGYSMFFFMSWLPDFLETSYHLNLKQVGLFSFLPWLLAAVLLWLVGYISDFIYRKTKCLRYARSYPIMLGQLLTLLCLIPIILYHDLLLTLISVSLAVAFSLSNNTAFYSTNLDVAKERAGSSLGLMNSGFAIAGFIAPTLTGELVQMSGSFKSAYILMILLTLSSLLVVFIFHRPDRSNKTPLNLINPHREAEN